MYYDKILRVWRVGIFYYFLLSAILGSFLASTLKDYVSEEKKMQRLRNSIIKKSNLVGESDKSIFNSKKIRKIYKIYNLANRGGEFQLQEFQANHEFSNEVFKLAQEIKGFVERLACFLKRRELKGVAKIFFKNGRLLLELFLYKCKIDISYLVLTEGLSTQVIVITVTAGGAAGFPLSWFLAGASVITPPLLFLIFSIRSLVQQIRNWRDFLKFKTLVNKMLEDDELKKTIRASFVEKEIPTATRI